MCTADEIMAQLGRPLAICSEPVDEDRANSQASSMIKSELIERITAQNPHLFQRDIEKVVNAILDEMVEALRRRSSRTAGFWSLFS